MRTYRNVLAPRTFPKHGLAMKWSRVVDSRLYPMLIEVGNQVVP